MNLGSKINELRKAKNITQEELAAELGVTAAAVSKWENGVCLPDILMLCALADYFGVTTDELLGRCISWKYAVIAAQTRELGEKIAELARRYGIKAKSLHTSYHDAVAAAKADNTVTHLLVGYHQSLTEDEWDEDIHDLYMCQCIYQNDQEIVDSLELLLKKFA